MCRTSLSDNLCVVPEDKLLEATDQEIKLPEGRVLVLLCLGLCEAFCLRVNFLLTFCYC